MNNHYIIITLTLLLLISLSVSGYLFYLYKKIDKEKKEDREIYLSRIDELRNEVSSYEDLEEPVSDKLLSIRIEGQNKLLDFIDDMIQLEVITVFRDKLLLDKPLNIMNADEDLKLISKNIFDGLKKDIILDIDNILTSEYLITYINKKTIYIYLNTFKNNNGIS